MSLGGTSDIREGIEEGDPLKVALGTLQTVTMFAGIGALGSTAKTAGLKAVGAIDDIAYKQAMTAIKATVTAGEAADAVSGGVTALQGAAAGNPVGVLAGLASIGTVDVPGKVTKEIAEELVKEGLEKVTKEAVEELAEEAVEKTVREAVEETTEAIGKQVDDTIEVIRKPAVAPKIDGPSGGRAGQSSAWNEYFGVEDTLENLDRLNQLDIEIEDLRQAVIKADDIDAAVKTLQDLDIPGANADTIEQMKKYLFDSEGLQFTPENYELWQRLTGASTEPPTFGDVSVVAHEMAEMDELKRLLTDAGLPPDPLGYERGPLTAPKWRELFNESHYLPAHSHALEVQHQFVADEVERLLKPANPDLEISFEEIASIDPTGGTEAQNFLRLTDQEGNWFTLKQHPNFQQWSSHGNEIVKLPSEIGETMKISGEQCTLREFIEQLIKLPLK